MRTALRTTGAGCAALFLGLAGCSSKDESVAPQPVPAGSRIAFTADHAAMRQGQSTRFQARVVDADGNTVPGAVVQYRLISSDTSAAVSLANDGTATGVAPGVGRIVASVAAQGSGEHGPSDTLDVDVFGHPRGLLVGSTSLAARPFGVDVSVNDLVYVTQLDAERVSKTDVAGQTITGSVAVGATPTGVAFAPDGATAYVTNQLGQNVGVIDVASGTQVATIPVHGDPFVVTVGPSGNRLYISSNTSWLWVADTHSREIVDSVPVGYAPNGFAIHPDAVRLYVTSVTGDVTEIDVSTNAVLRTFTPGGVPQGALVSPDGKELYVANEAGWLDVFDLATGGDVARIPLAGGGFGVALSPDLLHLYVSLPNAGTVQVVNTASRRVILTIETRGKPRRIAFDYHGGIAVVANEAGSVDFVR